jgi:hypothetical protein
MTDGPEVHVEASYLDVCAYMSEGGDDTLPQWQALAEMLDDRPGWRFAVLRSDEGLTASWCFGEHGSSLLIVDGEMEGFRIFDYLKDRSHVEPTLEGLRQYLRTREKDVDQHSFNTAVEYRDAIRSLQDN